MVAVSRCLYTTSTFKNKICTKKNFGWRSNQQLKSDLIDFSNLKKHNDVYCFVIVLIDVFSKFAYVECIKDKKCSTMVTAFEKLLKRSGPFLSLQTDRGTE